MANDAHAPATGGFALNGTARRSRVSPTSGFALAPILYLIALAGIAGAVLFTGYTQVLRSNVEITADNAARNQIRMASEVLASRSLLNGSPASLLPPAVQAISDATRLPKQSNGTAVDLATLKGGAHDIGGLPTTGGVRAYDPWGKFYIYCRWESMQSPGNGDALSILSAGADGILQTDCNAKQPATGSDDRMEYFAVANVLSRAATWQAQGDNTFRFGVSGDPAAGRVVVGVDSGSDDATKQLNIGGSGKFGGALSVGGALTVAGATTLTGGVTTGAINGTSITVSGDGMIGGNFGVTGATTLTGAVSTGALTPTSILGSPAATLGATTTTTLGASGPATLSSTLGVTGLATLATANIGGGTMGTGTALTVKGPTQLEGVSGTSASFGSTSAGTLTASGATIAGATTISSGNLTVTTGNLTLSAAGGTVTATNGNFTNISGTYGGTIDGSTQISGTVPIAHGGTGATDAATARTNLDVQRHSLELDGVAMLSTTGFVVRSGGGAYTARSLYNSDIPAFTGATTGAGGSLGGVPIAIAGQQNYVLTGGGAWADPNGLVNGTQIQTGNTGVYTDASKIVFKVNGAEQARVTGAADSTYSIKLTGGKSGTPPTISGVLASDGVTAEPLVVIGTLTGNASSATQLAVARTIGTSGDVTATATAFDGSANITIPTSVTAIRGTAVVATAPTTGQALIYNGTAYAPGSVTTDGGTIGATSGTQVVLPDGTVGTPSLRFLNNTNMGLYRPGADTMALVTAGVERLRIDGSGNVGIGANPITSLKLYLSTGLTNPATTTHGIYVKNAPAITAGGNTSENYGVTGSVQPTVPTGITNSAGSFSFRGDAYGFGAGTHGAVGGLYSNYGILTGNTATISSAFGVYVQPVHQAGTITSSYGVYLATPQTGGTVTNEYGLYQASTTAKNVFMGNVGIGTAAPAAKLDIYTDNLYQTGLTVRTNTAAGIAIVANGSNTPSLVFGNESGGGQSGLGTPAGAYGLTFNVRSGGSLGEAMRLDQTGLGIGAAPAYPLDVNGVIRASNEIISTLGSGGGQFRALNSTGSGFMIRNDGNDTYFLLTNSGDQYGGWNSLRPFRIQNSDGTVLMANNVFMNGVSGNYSMAAGGNAAFINGNNSAGGILDLETYAPNPYAHSGQYGNHAWQFYYTGAANSTIGSNALSIRFANGDTSTYTPALYFSPGTGSVKVGADLAPATKLDVAGAVKFGTEGGAVGSSCTGLGGAIRYNGTSNTFESCNGTVWGSLAANAGTGGSGGAVNPFLLTPDGSNLITYGANGSGTLANRTWARVTADATTGVVSQSDFWVGGASKATLTAGAFNIASGSGYQIGGTNALIFKGSGSIAIGNTAMGGVGPAGSVGIGEYALQNAGGAANVGVGSETLKNTTGANNVSIGYFAGRGSTGGDATFANSVWVGYAAGFADSTGGSNVGIGYQALTSNTTGYNNTALGTQSMPSNTTGYSNTVVGQAAMNGNTTGNFNNAFGVASLASNTTGNQNLAAGTYAMYYNTTGTYNVALGGSALVGNTTGASNVAVGGLALSGVTTGSNNTGLGDNAGANITTGSGNIIIGSGVQAGSATVSNQLNIGNAIYANLATGAVGIGTNAPIRQLTLAGTGSIEQVWQQTNAKADYRNWNVLVAGGSASVASNFYLRMLNDAGSAESIATPFFVNGANGNIGLGNTNPTVRLDVSGDVELRSRASVGADIARSGETDLYFKTGGIVNFYFYNTSTNGSTFGLARDDNSGTYIGSAFTVDKATGKMMIGSGATAATALEVNGSLKIGNGGETCGSGYYGAIHWTGSAFEGCTSGGWGPLASSGGAFSGTFGNNTWVNSAEGAHRFYFATNADTYIGSPTGWAFQRSSDSSNVALITNAGAFISNDQFRSNHGGVGFLQTTASYGAMWYNDDSSEYFLLTNSGSPTGTFNGLRPFSVENANGNVHIGNDALYVGHGNNVGVANSLGIGTFSPMRKLHLAGAGSIEQVLQQTDAKADYRNWNFVVGGGNASTAANFSLRLLNDAGTAGTIDNVIFANGTTGNVGIGTNAPGAKLTIANGATDPLNYGQALQIVNLSGNRQQIAFVRAGNNIVSMGYNGASPVWGIGSGTTTDSSFTPSFLAVDSSTGNVGIGSASPQTRLYLPAGEIGVGQQNDPGSYLRIGMDSSYNGYIASNATWSGSQYNYVSTTGYGGFASRLFLAGGGMALQTASGGVNPISWQTRLGVDTAGNISIPGNLVVSGTISGTQAFPNNTWIKSADSQNRFYFGTNGTSYFGSPGGWQFQNSAGTNLFTIDPYGNVTTTGFVQNPGEYITTASGPGFRQIQGNYGSFWYRDTAAEYFMITASGDQYGSFSALRPMTIEMASGNVGLAGNAIYAQHGGNVGIGTTAARGKLDISNSGNGVDGLVIQPDLNGDNTITLQTYIDNSWATRTTYASGCCNNLALQPDAGQVSVGGALPGGYANKFNVIGTSYLSGNVGIGTQTPAVSLDVNGAVAVNRNGVFLSGGGDTNHMVRSNSATDSEEFDFYNYLDFKSTASGASKTPLRIYGGTGDVEVGGAGDGRAALRVTRYGVNTRQFATGDWLDASSNIAGLGMVATNGYVGQADNAARFANGHGSIGSQGMITNYGGNPVSFFANTGATTQDAVFTPNVRMAIGSDGSLTVNNGHLQVYGAANVSAGFEINTQDNIQNRVNSGWYQTSSASTANGWPATTPGDWMLAMAATHSNYSNYYSLQLAGAMTGTAANSDFWVRSTNGNGATAWNKLITTNNISSYAMSSSGGTINGNLIVNGIGSFQSPNSGSTGAVIIRDAPGNPNAAIIQFDNNAATAQYGFIRGNSDGSFYFSGAITTSAGTMLTTGNEVDMTGVKHFLSAAGNIWAGSGSVNALEVNSAGGAGDSAAITFHRRGAYAEYFGMNASSQWVTGGWSRGNVQRPLWITGQIPIDSWQTSADGKNRFYFGNSGGTILGSQAGYYFRNAADGDIVGIFNNGHMSIGGSYDNGYQLETSGSIRSGDQLRANNEIISQTINGYGQFRAIGGNYGAIIRNDGGSTYFMLTASGDQYGQWNTLRPMMINDASGDVTFGSNANVNGVLRVDNTLVFTSANPTINTGGSYITIPNGAYFSGGTVYINAAFNVRSAVANDQAAILTINGGTSNMTWVNNTLGVGGTGSTPRGTLDVSNANDGVVIHPDLEGDNSTTIQGYIDNQWTNRATYAAGCCNSLRIQTQAGTVVLGNSVNSAVNSQVILQGANNVINGRTEINRNWDGTDGTLRMNGNLAAITWHDTDDGRNWLTHTDGDYFHIARANTVNSNDWVDKFLVSNGGDINTPLFGWLSGSMARKDVADTFQATMYFNDWIRVNGGTGIYWQAYSGGWNMTDSTYMRLYGDKTMYTGGNVQASGYYHNSDIRLKHDIRDYDGLAIIDQLRGVRFKWNKDNADSLGLIAQEAEKVVPELVTTNADGMKTVMYDALVSPLIEAVKSLHKMIDALTVKVEALLSWQATTTTQLDSVTQRLDALEAETAALKAENAKLRAAVHAPAHHKVKGH